MCNTGGVWKYIYPRAKKIFRGSSTAEDIVRYEEMEGTITTRAFQSAVQARERARVYADCLAEFKKALSYWYVQIKALNTSFRYRLTHLTV